MNMVESITIQDEGLVEGCSVPKILTCATYALSVGVIAEAFLTKNYSAAILGALAINTLFWNTQE